MKKVIAIVVVYTLLAYGKCFAQAEYLPTPPSVDARTFLQNINYPVSNYTGTVNVEIPVCKINLKDFELPVSLTYNTSGVKVEQEASTVGLGWMLDASGIITKTIMGENDLFRPYTYFSTPCSGSPHIDCNDLPDIKGLMNPGSNCTLSDYLWDGVWFLSLSREIYFNALMNSVYDEDFGGREFAPDLFNYSFSGYSGSFIFDRQKKIIKEKEDNVKIVPKFDRYGDIESWTATTPKGTKYYFDKVEKVQYKGTWTCNSSWHLTKIETPGGSWIEFIYLTKSKQYWTFSRYQEADNNGTNPDGFSLKHQQYCDCVYLDEIRFNGGSIAFYYAFDRKDAKWLPRLTSIKRFDHSGKNTTIWEMNQTYFNATALNNDLPTVNQIQFIDYTSDYDNDWNTKRLKLDGVTVMDPDTGESNGYQLTYKESDLPTKLSAGVDHWGYYNGRSNTVLIGRMYHNISENGTVKLAGYDGADREAYDNYNQAYILTKIKYPTGGMTEFTYESNQYLVRIMENDHHKKDFYYGEENVAVIEPSYYKNAPSSHVNTKPLHIPSVGGAQNQLAISYYVEVNCDIYRTHYSPDLSFTLRLVKSGTPVWSRLIKVPELPRADEISKDNNKFKGTEFIQVPAGEYELQVTGSLRQKNDSTYFGVKRYITPDENIAAKPVRNGGGLRIKEIASTPAASVSQAYNLLAKKIYRYSTVTYGDWSKITGKLMSLPRYNIGYDKYCSNGLRNTGYSVGYSRVYVSEVDKSGVSNGTIGYEYINKPDSNLYYRWEVRDSRSGRVSERSVDENPVGAGPFRFPENGTLLSETYYDNRDNTVKKTEYEYDFFGGLGNMIWGVAKNYSEVLADGHSNSYLTQADLTAIRNLLLSTGYDIGVPMGYLYPAMIPTEVKMKKKRDILHNPLSLPNTESTAEYKYHNSFSNFVTRITETAGGEQSVTEYKYPFDFDNTIMNTLTDNNRISDPVETNQYRNGELIMHKETGYGFYPQYTAAPLPTAGLYKTEESQQLIPTIEYHSYDKYGNPQHITVNHVDKVYIWSYGGQYPVLEIENATMNQLRTALGALADEQIALLTQNSLPGDMDFEKLNSLRALLPQSMITVYRYEPGFGVVSITDPRGVITKYMYDNFGRLTRVTEKTDAVSDGAIISIYRYNYAK